MNLLKRITLEKCIVRLLVSWCLVGTVLLFSKSKMFFDISFFQGINFVIAVVCMALVFVALNLLLIRSKGMMIDKILLFSVYFIYFSKSLFIKGDIYYYIGVMVLTGILIYYCFNDFEKDINISGKTVKSLFIILAFFLILFIGGLTALRYVTYNAPGFDFGIFTQMFNSMKTTLLPDTTVERDMLLSHFAIHASPIFYILLPIYYLFPSPVTLQVAQAVVLGSSLFPLYLLCKKFELSNYLTLLIGICFSFYPALIGGCFYDIHENAFLTPLILWLFYFIEKDKFWGIFTFSALIFMVKEDAPVYVAFIAVYMIFGKKQYKKGMGILAFSVIYFIAILWLLKTYGQGAMFDRYNNYNFDGSGIISVIKTFILNPAYVISQCMTQDKLIFAMQILIPLGFLPLLNKSYAKYILVGPFVLINLMSNYSYQHSIDFQYNFGVIAIFFYLVISNLSGIKPQLRKIVAVFCVTATVLLFSATMAKKIDYINTYAEQRKTTQSLNKCVEMIPKDADVSASAFIIPHLYNHETLYELPTKHATEYVIVDLRVNTEGVSVFDYENLNFKQIYYDEGVVALFKRN